MLAKIDAKLDALLGPIVGWTTPVLMLVVTFGILLCNPVAIDSDPEKTFADVAAELGIEQTETDIPSEDAQAAAPHDSNTN